MATARSPPGTVPMAQLAADVRHLLDTKGIATAALAGLSMGGLVVMELAAAQPDRWWAYSFIATTAQRATAEEQQARRASARTMEAPALVCTGDRDSYSTAQVTAELVTCLHDPEVVRIDGVGHLTSWP